MVGGASWQAEKCRAFRANCMTVCFNHLGGYGFSGLEVYGVKMYGLVVEQPTVVKISETNQQSSQRKETRN